MKSIIMLACAVVAIWGATSLATGVVYVTAPTNALSSMLGSPLVDAAWYLMTALLAVVALAIWPRRPYRWLPLVLTLPLVFTISMAAVSSTRCVLAAMYADKVVRPHGFILKDQVLMILFGAWLIAAVLEVHCKPALSMFSSRSRA